MNKVAFIVDSSSGIKNGEIQNVFVIPLVITKNENGKLISLKDQIDIDDKTLCELLNNGADIGTSQPSPGEMVQLVESIYDKYDQIFVLPIHPKLSSAINTWRMVKEDYDKLHVITSYSLSSLTRYYVEYFLKLSKKEDLTEQKIIDYIESTKTK
ncbi:MAG: DegV family protein [Mycoplasmoidaceae bacterium]|nr:DegV family protein [Mycoplasmoidaceae bacterium]